MIKLRCISIVLITLASVVLLTGCQTSSRPKATAEDAGSKTPAVARAQSVIPEMEWQNGINLYNEGNFNEALKRLGVVAGLDSADKAMRVSAYKFMAFSYCLTHRPKLCQQSFEKALRLAPNFSLAPGESGHPLWAQSLERAQKAVQTDVTQQQVR